MVQLYVSHLRPLLDGSGARIVTRGRGYELQLPDDEVDAVRFERLLDESRAREALALWRGDALADLADEPFAAAEIRRLEELRLRAAEMRDRRRPGGRPARRGDRRARALVAAHPLREHLHAQRMLALYRSGRQSEALEAYREARTALVEQIGVEPGRASCTAAGRDPRARPGARPPRGRRGRAAEPRRGRRRRARRWLLIGAAVLLLAGITAFGVIRVLEPDGSAAASTRTPSG